MARLRCWQVGDVDHVKLHHLVIALRRCRFKPGLVARGAIVGRAQIGAVQMINRGHVRVAVHDQVFNDGSAVASKIISGIHRALPVFPNPFVRALPVADQRFDQIECVVSLGNRRRPALIMLSLGRNENARNKNSCQIISHSALGFEQLITRTAKSRRRGPIPSLVPDYSVRSATMGLMRVARRAGNQAASRGAAARTTNALANAGGSNAPTSKRIPLSIFPVAAASSRPRASPLKSMTEPSRIINRNTIPGCAPSAMRIPISRVRRATEYALTP